MDTQEPVNRQLLVVYGIGKNTKVYTAAYTQPEANMQLARCYKRHGASRIIRAEDLPPDDLLKQDQFDTKG